MISPIQSQLSAPFWEGCAIGELRLQLCRDCNTFRYHPKLICATCFSDHFEWQKVTGRGVIHSYTIVHRAPNKTFKERTPYVIGLVHLEEGPKMMTNIVDTPHDHLRIGLPVNVVFESGEDGVYLPFFRESGE